ncbi:hypothetical protein [Nautilia sp.]
MKIYLFLIVTFFVFTGCGGGGSRTQTDETAVSDNSSNEIYITPYCKKKEHPRLWIRNDLLNMLKFHRANNTRKWVEFKRMCDSITDGDPSNDPYGLDESDRANYVPQQFTAPLALMYYLTGDEKYAKKSIELMEKSSDDFSHYGDPDHKGYEMLALAYDWLYGYGGFNRDVRDKFHSLMKKISDKFWNGYNINASGTDSDLNLLTGALHLMYGIALYGDYEDAVVILERGWKGWNNGYNSKISNRDIIKAGIGGVYFTGMAYLASTDIKAIAENQLSLETGCGYDFEKNETDLKAFWGNLIQAFISLTDPKKKIIEDYGSWQDPSTLSTQPWFYRALSIAEYFAYTAGDTRSAYGKYFRDNTNVGYENDPFLELFFNVPDQYEKAVSYENLPSVYFAKNPDFLLYRQSWEENSSWCVFRGDGTVPLDQQGMDQGHFSIYRNGEYLTKGARNYDSLTNGDFYNILSIENGCEVNGESCKGTPIFDSQKPAEITRVRISFNPKFAYVMMNADGQWNDNPDKTSANLNVISYRRHFFHTGEYFVVFDRIRLKNPADIKYRIRSLTEPVIRQNMLLQNSVSGNSRLLHKTVIPSNITVTKVDETDLWKNLPDWKVPPEERKWQSVIDFGARKNLNILNLMQTGGGALNDFDTLEVVENNDSNGLMIGNWAVMFAGDELLRDTVVYTLNNAPVNLNHLVADLKEGEYIVKINGKAVKTAVAAKDATIYFTTGTAGRVVVEIVKK